MRNAITTVTAAVLMALAASLFTAGPANAANHYFGSFSTKAKCEARGNTILNNQTPYDNVLCLAVPINPTKPWKGYLTN